jgi:hypothetical protein
MKFESKLIKGDNPTFKAKGNKLSRVKSGVLDGHFHYVSLVSETQLKESISNFKLLYCL